jgi:4-alpha-glucanotransferase
LENVDWLNDHALYKILKSHFKNKPWNQWSQGLKNRDGGALESVRKKHCRSIEEEKFIQFIFDGQWGTLKRHCQNAGIRIIGDIPIYVSFDSADVWANPGYFKLDHKLNPVFVAGVPPDYFSSTGQRWGNPVYNWRALKKHKYDWWMRRIGHNLKLYDFVRIDHFRGFVAFWQVPVKEKTAIHGQWIKGPGQGLFNRVKKVFPKAVIIAEDIGHITPAVRNLIKSLGYPGMKVLQFAFGDDRYDNDYLPSAYIKNCVAYTGTHDNNTIRGWFLNEITSKQRAFVLDYMDEPYDPKNFHWQCIKLLMNSKADLVIIPLQDVLGLGEEAKMNKPATANGNWEWRLERGLGNNEAEGILRNLVLSTKRGK